MTLIEMMMAHTPGPWDCDEGDFTIYELDGMKPIDFGYEPNARLIAAAPDLLAALKAIVNDQWCKPVLGSLGIRARAAIAKAEGVQK